MSATSTGPGLSRAGAPPVAAQVAAARQAFASGRTRPLQWRRAQLLALIRMVGERSPQIEAALREDLAKPPIEAYLSEVATVRDEAAYVRRNLPRWLRDRPARGTVKAVGVGTAWTRLEPLGTVLVMAPWNFPFRLTLMPVIGAVAAGNSVVVKPSELAPASSALLADLLPRYLDPEAVQVVEGGVDAATALLEHRFDHILYTGNARVASTVMAAAAAHLTPVTLELGGRSPVWVDDSANLDKAARTIAWGKFGNAGQACVAPDHVLTTPDLAPRLAEAVAAAITRMYGDEPALSPDFPRIVNERHTRRLAGLLGSGRVVTGGQVDVEARYVAPTVLLDPAPDAPVLADEIFGPILPVVTVPDLAAAIARISAGPAPLALYAFTEREEVRRAILDGTSSGSVAFNTVMAQLAVSELPFGGVGRSGMGAYHGERSVRTFSHERAILRKLPGPDLPALARPPFRGIRARLLRLY